jgi:hypothetical protein
VGGVSAIASATAVSASATASKEGALCARVTCRAGPLLATVSRSTAVHSFASVPSCRHAGSKTNKITTHVRKTKQEKNEQKKEESIK